MVRYLGEKPRNWAAAVLIFGWMGFGFLGVVAWSLDLLEPLSIFRRDLPAVPLTWEGEMSLLGFILVMSPMLLGILACWLVPASDYSTPVSWALVIVGAVGALAGIAWDLRSGTAFYGDRVVSRGPGFHSDFATHPLTEIVRVEVSCTLTRRRRSSSWTATPAYWLTFRDAYEVDGWELATGPGRWNTTETLDRLEVIHSATNAAGAARAPRRRPNGASMMAERCLPMVADRMGVSVERLQTYFVVHRSELRDREYTLVPAPSRTAG
jgi:hypothetical protein